ncbi:hypothetical protein [Pseudomonas mosselii]|uniref:hypothetical protein n=1 Tax=Pseudomonas mosselii TaxID=78327 RepID=UPI000D91A5D4|nr:hypothetical protein [Pseudomonas mosselii]PYC10815.1 hypothetical protein DMX06_25985 [Pseudomonas mosselii]
MARIENHKYSIEEAFRECFYIVPDYQREYVWTDKEVHCSGLLTPDTHLGENARHREVSDDQATPYLYP